MTKTEKLISLINSALQKEAEGLYAPSALSNLRSYMCKVEDCPNRAYAKGLCNAHYIRARKGRSLSTPLRHRTGGCCRLCDKPVDSKGGWALCKAHFRARRRRVIRGCCIEFMGGACADCGESFPHAVYDFHHLNSSEKEHSPSNMIDASSISAIAAEAAKCILLCANCHRIRHCSD